MGLTTPRFALPYPVLADPNDPPADLLALATVLDNKMMVYLQGTLASRPAAGTINRVYFATDTKDVSFDTGAVWRSLTGNPTIPAARYWCGTNPAMTGTAAVIPWNTTTFNRNGTPTAATKVIVPVAGYWRVRAHAKFNIGSSPNTGILQIRQGPNSDTAGTVIAAAQKYLLNGQTVEVEATLNLAASGDFAIWGQMSGASNTLNGATTDTYLEYELVTAT
jgi:hypothetical protein